MKRAGRFGWGALAFVAFWLILVTIAGFGGAWYWPLDLLANFRPHLFVLLAGCGGVAALAGWRRLAFMSLAGASINLVLIVPFYLSPAPPQPPESAPVLSVMALNVKVRAVDADALAEYLRETDADLVFLFAAPEPYVRALSQADIPYTVVLSRQPRSDLEMIVLARDPLVVTALHQMGSIARSMMVEAIVELDGTPVRVIGTHPNSPLIPERAAQRDRHLADVGRWIAEQTDPVLLVGDLNATPWSHAFRGLIREAGLKDSLRQGFGLQPSWPSPWHHLGIPIDHALHTPELVTVERYLGPSLGSDHRALHITVALAPQPPPSPPRSSRSVP